ncbi:monothiol glutaredoxin [Fonticula alba]|uniref:Monothiol glutaredoxin n=1 Tax=Fonticula alba TaxID=691883 RepID=A0A058Z863_FONAL|nr:monothiol glutaredoxin [Fonticula alba]KCV70454.1 monothiol glutaredoxin [Fonticula alba]|eukprot:XP_009494970.1 monothiol glutaredoxin [Fonticula alba]
MLSRTALFAATLNRTALRAAAARPAVAPLMAMRSMSSVSPDLLQQLDKTIKDNDIVVFMKGVPEAPRCGFSRGVVQLIGAAGVSEFKAIDVLESDEVRQGIKDLSSWPTLPQVYIKGEFVGGFDIVSQLYSSGELHNMLRTHNLIPTEEKASE